VFWTVVYLVFTYLIVFGAVRLALRLVSLHLPVTRRVRGVTLAVLLPLPLVPYGVVAVQTAVYGPTLRQAVFACRKEWMGEPDRPSTVVRVLRVTPDTASVLVIIKNGPGLDQTNGEVIHLLRAADGAWRFAGWDVHWSSIGSADGNVFPPYLEAKEF